MKSPLQLIAHHSADYGFQASFKKTPAKPNIFATIESHKDQVFAVAVAGSLLYTASDSKDIRVFRAPTFEEVDCFGSGSGVVQSLMAFEDRLYSAHQDHKIRVWRRVESGVDDNRCEHTLVSVLPRFEHRLKSMLLNRNYVDVRRHKKMLWIEHADMISALALGSSEAANAVGRCLRPSVLYTASWDKTVKVWSLNNFKCMESFYAHHDAINAMVVIDGTILATASADGTIKLWTRKRNPKGRRKHGLINTLKGHEAAVNALAISDNFNILYSGGSEGTVVAWKRAYSCKPQARSSMRGSSVSGEVQKPSGSKGRENIIRTSSLADELSLGSGGSEEMRGENSLTNQDSWSIRTVMSSNDNQLRAVRNNNIVEFRMKKVLIGHARAVLSVSKVRNSIVCSSSADKTVRVWERRKGWEYACIAVLAGHGGPVKAIASVSPRADHILSPAALHVEEDDDEGAIVYSAGLDSKVKVWAVNTPPWSSCRSEITSAQSTSL